MTGTSKFAKNHTARRQKLYRCNTVAVSLQSLVSNDATCCCSMHRLLVWPDYLDFTVRSSATERAARDGSSNWLWPCMLRW